MRILITGGSGFLGSCFAVDLLEKGEEVIILDAYPNPNLLGDSADKMEIIKGDLLDYETLRRSVERYMPDVIVHLAAYRNTECQEKPMGAFKLNCEGMMNVLEVARTLKVKRLIYASSVGVYGSPNYYRSLRLDPFRVTEDFPANPFNVYGVTKLFNEGIARQYRDIFGLEAIGLRFPIIYGPGKKSGSRTSVFNDVIECPLKGESVTINSYKDQVFNFLYVKDASHGLICACSAPSLHHSIFNIGGTRCRTRDLAQSVREMVPGARITLKDTDQEGAAASGIDSTLAKEELGYEAQFDLKRSITDYQQRLSKLA